MLAPAFEQAAAELSVPPAVTKAIARVESGENPYSLNIEGKTFFYPNKAAALNAARKALAVGKSFDSGIMQVNSGWLNRFHIPLDAALDPEANIWLGSWILSRNLQAHGGNLETAVALYHSPDPARGSCYLNRVKAALKANPDIADHAALPPSLAVTAAEKTGMGSGQIVVTPPITRHDMTRPASDFVVRQEKLLRRTFAESDFETGTENSDFVRRFADER